MRKKLILGTLLGLITLLLVIGGLNRTRDRLVQSNDNDAGAANLAADDEASSDKWEMARATVTAIRSNGLWLELEDGTQARARRAAWNYAQEQGFTAEGGDRISLTGYMTTGGFEIVSMHNEENGLEAVLRDENGRSLWAGRGDE